MIQYFFSLYRYNVISLYRKLALNTSVCVTTGERENFVLGNKVVVAVDSVLQCRSSHCELKKIKEAGALRTIQRGRAKVAEAPKEEDWQQAAVYIIQLPQTFPAASSPLLQIDYCGDCARLYADGKLVADNFYYGRPFMYGLWRLPKGCIKLELRILPLQPNAPIYLPREAEKKAGEALNTIMISCEK